jgi:sugar phosphate isomerase/epimerase
MRFGAMNFPVKPLLEQIEMFSELGLDYLELALDPPLGHHQEVMRQKTPITQALRRHRMGLVCHLPTFVYLADLSDSIRRASLGETAHALAAAAALGASKVVLHPPIMSGLGSFVPETVHALSMDSLSRLTAQAAASNLTVCIENMFPRCGVYFTPEDFEPLFSRYPELMLTLDIGHAHISAPVPGQSPAVDFIRRWGRRIGHVHVSDNHGQRDEHLPLGSGTVDWPEVVAALVAAGYDRTVTLEVFSEQRQDLVDGRERLRQLLAGM